jgi:ABC-2 type transport system permease protein
MNAVKFVRETWLMFAANLTATVRNPIWIIVGMFQPACYLILFTPLLRPIAAAPGFPAGGALRVFTPGLVVMMGMFGSAFVGFGLIADLRAGVIERLRVTPVNRLALLLGRGLRDVAMLLLQTGVLLLVTWLLGLQASPAGVAITLGLVVLIGLLMSSISYGLALVVRDEDALASTLNLCILPLMLLSGIMLPLALAPRWLRAMAKVNPLAYAVDASRALFIGNLSDPSVGRGFVMMAVLAGLAIWWAAQSFRNAIA